GHNASAGIHVPDDSAFSWYVEAFTALRMPLFSFLTGFIYSWRLVHDLRLYPRILAKKARRLLVPYVVFIPIIGVAQSVVDEANNPTTRPPLEWFLNALSPYWFLLATFWIFAVIALLDATTLLRAHCRWPR
uniref:acyltransferase family protein n=1 Tax=uncultured Microbacterium sp. TaxID=191216 RepID=UPI0025D81B58